MKKKEIKQEARNLNDFVYVTHHEGATQNYFDAMAFSVDEQRKIMEASLRMMFEQIDAACEVIKRKNRLFKDYVAAVKEVEDSDER